MSKYLFIAIVTISTSACAEEIKDYRFYQADYNLSSSEENFATYVLKNDPCVTVEMLGSGEK